MVSATNVAARLLRYTDKEKKGQMRERVLYSEGYRCRVPTAEKEFARTREVHGTQGAMKKVPFRYDLPRDGEVATHLRRVRPSGRKYWAVPVGDEEATHVQRQPAGDVYQERTNADGAKYWAKLPPGAQLTGRGVGGGLYVPQREALHVIVSFGHDEVNPEDPQQTKRAFEAVVAEMTDLYPGCQIKFVGQADGKGMTDQDGTRLTDGQCFHVHCVINATVSAEMTVDGRTWGPGKKLSGPLTDVERIRERSDEWIEQHGHEFGLTQKLPSMAAQRAERRDALDRRMEARSAVRGTELSRADRIRNAAWEVLDEGAKILPDFKDRMAERGIAVTEPGWRRGKPPKVPRLSYTLDGMTFTARRLGTDYDYAQVHADLDDNLMGRPRRKRPERPKAGPPRPLDLIETPEEEQSARAAKATLELQMEQIQRIDEFAVADGYSSGAAMFATAGWSILSEHYRTWFLNDLVEQQAAARAEKDAAAQRERQQRVEEQRSWKDRLRQGMDAETDGDRQQAEERADRLQAVKDELGIRGTDPTVVEEPAVVEEAVQAKLEDVREPEEVPVPEAEPIVAEEPPVEVEESLLQVVEPSAVVEGEPAPPALATASSADDPDDDRTHDEGGVRADEVPQWRPGEHSGLEDWPLARERDRGTRDQMVALDKAAQVRLADGEPVTGELTRGLRAQTLATHEAGMDPAVVHQLWRALAKRTEARRVREEQGDVALSDQMRAELEAGDLGWPGEPSDLSELRELARRKSRALRQLQTEVAEEGAQTDGPEQLDGDDDKERQGGD